MNLKVNETGPLLAAAPENLERMHRFILRLQTAAEINELWLVFLEEVKTHLVLKEALLIYKAGMIFEHLELVNYRIVHKPLTHFSFLDPAQDFQMNVARKKLVIFKREGDYSAQMELKLSGSFNLNDEPAANERSILTALAEIFMNQLILHLQIKNYAFHSIKDDITLAYNQNYLKAFIQNEVERAKRYATVFSIIFFDLDNLKAINEAHGHLIGTELLKEVASILKSQIRKVDLLSRFGGDEFVIVLLHADPDKAYQVCLRIREKINSHVFMENKNLDIHVTGCFGISSFPENGMSVDDLIRKADLAMYDVKRKGKDEVKIYQER
jgi:diguanylate cyclase (GGDEF)-like protein